MGTPICGITHSFSQRKLDAEKATGEASMQEPRVANRKAYIYLVPFCVWIRAINKCIVCSDFVEHFRGRRQMIVLRECKSVVVVKSSDWYAAVSAHTCFTKCTLDHMHICTFGTSFGRQFRTTKLMNTLRSAMIGNSQIDRRLQWTQLGICVLIIVVTESV